jgi:3-deoxy-manno-octulosonate cytidylyltransferase (CMP-KDO synthetase)
MKKIVALIPARLDSSRLPKKLLQLLGTQSVIANTYLNAQATQLFDDVICITDSLEIKKNIESIGGIAYVSEGIYDCGTDRIAAFAAQIDADIIINIQGDEPFINKNILQLLINLFEDKEVQVASTMMKISESEAKNPNFVKVICNANNNAILFSRSVIPYNRDCDIAVQYYKHIGIYAFRKMALLQFAALPQPALEKIEKLENLRFIHNNIPIRMIETNEQPIGIDTMEDLEKAREKINNANFIL